jgi:HK97 gp10 family phage protein
MAETIKIDGLRELGEAMRRLSSDVANRAARGATSAAATLVKKAAKAKVTANPSVETGSLRDAIISKKLPKGQTQLTSEHIVTVRGRGKKYNRKGQKIALAPHGRHVEFGTVNMPAEPFLRPALANNVRPAAERMRTVLKRAIDKAGKR